MISIRLRIFLLALVTIAAVLSAFYIEYYYIQKNLTFAKNTALMAEDIQSVATFIHSMQKERGLTAGHLSKHNERTHILLLKQRKKTLQQLKQLEGVELLQNTDFSENFFTSLIAMQQQIDAKKARWQEAKEFYTQFIQQMHQQITLKLASQDFSTDISYELRSFSYLARVRENLGLIRAMMNRGYHQGEINDKEKQSLQHYYANFKDNLNTFDIISKMHVEKTQDSSWLVEFHNDVFDSVIQQINQAVDNDEKRLSGSSLTWWQESTLTIDLMKKTEDLILLQIKQYTSQQISYYKIYLFWYGVFAVCVLMLVALLTSFTVVRIFKALSILIHSLNNIQQTQNYGLRINSDSKDEFGKISHSINELLSCTDKLIKDKDFLASTDLLTGLMNRRSFIKIAENEIKRNKRYATPLSLIYCDIDFFKKINDSYGHIQGDTVLTLFAQTLQKKLRSSDFIARWGGEEFIILATETDLESAKNLAENLRLAAMEMPIENIQQVTASFGVAQKIIGESFSDWCKRADDALYQAKNTGRNKVCV